jgi:tRNA threonylcarbamoyladenosine biosynthesis protein TsaE
MTDGADSTVSCFLLATRRATRQLARDLSSLLRPSDLVILDGQLGSGKTFFVRALCRALGLSERIRVTSPTFSLIHQIGTTPPIAHADLYRLTSVHEVHDLGLLERRDWGDIVIVEWGLPYTQALGGDALVFEFRHEPRRVHARSTGPRAQEVLAALVARRAGPSTPRPLL